jgi:hypothetical protein
MISIPQTKPLTLEELFPTTSSTHPLLEATFRPMPLPDTSLPDGIRSIFASLPCNPEISMAVSDPTYLARLEAGRREAYELRRAEEKKAEQLEKLLEKQFETQLEEQAKLLGEKFRSKKW